MQVDEENKPPAADTFVLTQSGAHIEALGEITKASGKAWSPLALHGEH